MNDRVPLRKQKIVRILSVIFRFVFIAVILWYLFSHQFLDVSVLFRMRINPYFLGFIFVPLAYIFTTLRWLVLLQAQNIRVTFWDAFKLNLVGAFFNLFMPGAYSGDLIKIYYAMRQAKGLRTAVTLSVVLDRFIGLQTILLLASIAAIPYLFLFWSQIPFQLRVICILMICFCLGSFIAIAFLSTHNLNSNRLLKFFVAKLGSRVSKILTKLSECLVLYRSNLGKLGLSYVHSLLNQLSLVCVFFFAERMIRFDSFGDGQIFGPALNFFQHLLLDPIGIVISFIPISPMSIGLREGTYAFLYSTMNNALGAETGMIITVSFALWFAIFGGLSFILMKHAHANIFCEIQSDYERK